MAQPSTFELRDLIIDSVRKRDGAVTVGDVVADTGIPVPDAESQLREMLSLYKSHLDVDDDGNLRYRFDTDFTRRGEEKGRLWHEIKKKAWAAFVWTFKIWIMVTLVGYTLVFIILLLALSVAGLAASASSDSSDGLGELLFMPFYLLIRMLEFFFWMSLFDDTRVGRRAKRKSKKPEKPFYQRVFDFVFGPEIKRDPMQAHRRFAQVVRAHHGVLTATDWARVTGQSLEEADNALTAAAMRYHGDVEVSDDGTLLYRFDELRITAATGLQRTKPISPIWTRPATLPPLTGNKGSTNGWIMAFNGFNLLMASLVLLSTAGVLTTAGMVGLGAFPLLFSILFFAIPGYRAIRRKKEEKLARRENMRREAIRRVYESIDDDQGPRAVHLPEIVAPEVAEAFEGQPRVTNDGRTFYLFESVAEQLTAGKQKRDAMENQVVFGHTVFSSDEKEKSMAEADLEDFDRRLAAELENTEDIFAFEYQTAGAR